MVTYYEDFSIGDTIVCEGRRVTKEEMVSFAERFDPQPFHLDEEAAAESIFGELVASGLFTLCVAARITIDSFMRDVAGLAGLGYDALRWHHPVRPGDVLSVELEVLEKQITRPDGRGGEIRFRRTVTNQAGTTVLSFESINLVERRDR